MPIVMQHPMNMTVCTFINIYGRTSCIFGREKSVRYKEVEHGLLVTDGGLSPFVGNLLFWSRLKCLQNRDQSRISFDLCY